MHVLLRRGDRGKDKWDLAAEGIDERLAAALVWHVLEPRAPARLEELGHEMGGVAGARGAIGEGLGFRRFDELFERADTRGGMRHEDQRGVAQLGHRGEIPKR